MTQKTPLTFAFRELVRAAQVFADALEAGPGAQPIVATEAPKCETPAPSTKAQYAAAAEAVLRLIKDAGRGAALDVLARFEASKLPEVDPLRLADVAEAANAAREAHVQAGGSK